MFLYDINKFIKKVLQFVVLSLILINCVYAQSLTQLASSEQRSILSMDMNHERMCWVKSNNQLECMGKNNYSQSLSPMTIGDHKMVRVGTDLSHKAYACAVELDGVLKCWFPYDVPFPFVIKTIKNPKEMALTPEVEGASCAILQSNEVQCWQNLVSKIGITSHEISDVEKINITDVKYIATNDDYFCAIRFSGELKCWTKDGFLLDNITDKKFKNASNLFFKKSKICISNNENTYCSNYHYRPRNKEYIKLDFKFKFEKLDNIKFYTTSADSSKNYDSYLKGSNINYICGTLENNIKCFNYDKGSLAVKIPIQGKVNDYRLILSHSSTPIVKAICYVVESGKVGCERHKSFSKDYYKLYKNFYTKKFKSLASSTLISNSDGCFLQASNKISCPKITLYHANKVEFDMPTQANTVISKVYIEDDYTCAIINGNSKCWGKIIVDEGRHYEEVQYNVFLDATKEQDANLKTIGGDKSFIIQGSTKHCQIIKSSVKCEFKNYDDRRGSTSKSNEAVPFKSQPFYIQEFINNYSRQLTVCGVSNEEFKCWDPRLVNLEVAAAKGQQDSTFVLISGVKYSCTINHIYSSARALCVSPFYDIKDDHFFGLDDHADIVLHIPEEAEKYDYFTYDVPSKKICGLLFDNSLQRYCWEQDDFVRHYSDAYYVRENSKLNYSFSIYDRNTLCGIVTTDGEAKAICELKKDSNSPNFIQEYNVNSPWFISSFDYGTEGWRRGRFGDFSYKYNFLNSCVSSNDGLHCGDVAIDNVITHINVANKFLQRNSLKNLKLIDEQVYKYLNNLPLYYIGILRATVDSLKYEMKPTNFIVNNFKVRDEYVAYNKLVNILFSKVIYIFDQIDDLPIVKTEILPALNNISFENLSTPFLSLEMSISSKVIAFGKLLDLNNNLLTFYKKIISDTQIESIHQFQEEVSQLRINQLNIEGFAGFKAKYFELSRSLLAELSGSSALPEEYLLMHELLESVNDDLKSISN